MIDEQNLYAFSWVRVCLFLMIWVGGGLWGLDVLSARRELNCDPQGTSAQCTISEQRISGRRTVLTLPVNEIEFAKETDFSSSFGSPSSTTLELHTKNRVIWIANDDLDGGISKWSGEIAINDYLKSKDGEGIRLRAAMPSAFIVTSIVFAAVSAFLLGAIVFGRRLVRSALAQ